MRSDRAAGGNIVVARTAASGTRPTARGCVVLLALALVACNAGTPADATAAADAADANPAPIDPAKTMNPADLKDVTASYRCDEGHRIDIVRDAVARLALADGRVLKIEAIQGSVPPTFMDVGLTISLVSYTEAKLDDEEGNTVTCTRIETLTASAS